MTLSTEAIISIVAALITIPGAALIVWRCYTGSRTSIASGRFTSTHRDVIQAELIDAGVVEEGLSDQSEEHHLRALSSRAPSPNVISFHDSAPNRSAPSQRLAVGLYISFHPDQWR